MRLHRLELTAFGPYATTETVDFDALAEAGLFLLHGPTGAGKTSILDAICFALFGQVPGVRQKAQRLRSDHASLDVAPSVTLELTIRGRRIEITRSPAWQRPKRRGDGTTTEQAKTLLRERQGEQWREVSHRNDEASKHVIELLGMSAEQFTQVVLLPQGQFAEFLRADAEARRPLLEKLFNTAFYSDVEAALTAQRHELRSKVTVCDQQRREAVSRLVEAAGANALVDDLVALDDEDLETWAREAAAAVGSRAEQLGAAAEAATLAAAEARAALESAEALALAQQQRRQACEALARLDEQTEALAAQRDRLQVARKADRLRGHLEVLADRRSALAEAAVLAAPAVAKVSNDAARLALITSLPDATGLLLDTAALQTAALETAGFETAGFETAHLQTVHLQTVHLQAGDSETAGLTTAALGMAAARSAPRLAGQDQHDGACGEESPVGLELVELEDGQLVIAVDAALSDLPRQLAFGDEVDQGIPARPTQAAPADDDHLRAVAWERACQEWLEELRLNERSCREERGRLSELQTAVDNARRAEDRRDALLRDRDAARRLVEQLREQLDGMSEPAASDARLAELRAEAGQQSAAAADVELWASRLAAATRLQEQVLRLTELEERSRTAIDEAQARVDDWQRLRQARLDGFAAELAATLAEGEPCSVCGSTEHPAPATASDGVSEADETQAEQAAQVAMQARHTAELACSKLREEMAATRAAAGGSTASGISTAAREADLIAIAAQALAAAQARCGAIECAVAELARLEAERATLTAARERARQELHEAQLRLADREAAAAAATREAAEQLGTLVTVLRLEAAEVICAADLPDLAAARSQLDEECERLLTAGDALSALLDAARAAVLTLEAARAAADSASVDLAIAIDGAMSPEELDELEMEVSAYDEARAAVAATLSDEQLLAAASAPAPDVAAVEHRMAEAERVARQASAEAGAALVAARRCGELLTELVTHLGDSAPVRARHALVSELAFCLEGSGGGNALRMRLSAYVLAARLEAVAEVASQRLSHISGGRYALKHSDESSGRGRSGLGLKVVDGWTGAERDTSTLSGGETFFVSLALALALADVVTAEAGGVLLETLFVDEGFGSLDEETLDEVMATLDALRDGGRVVGVVSHVADMRQRIPAQLEVRKSRHGSSLVLHGV